jgi:Ca2+-binding RTX toxin-like protein
VTVPTPLRRTRFLAVLATTALIGVGMEAEAAASGTASISGPTLVYEGDATTEHVEINREPVRDDNGTQVGAIYSVQDIGGGGVAKGISPCGPHENFDAFCPFGSSTLRVKLGGGGDTFRTVDNTVETTGCRALQSSAALRLDGGSGDDLIDGGRLANRIAGGPGSDGISTWSGNDRVSGGSGVDLIETRGGSDVADGGSGSDVIHLDSNPVGDDAEYCSPSSGKPGNDIGRGGAGNDAISAEGGNDRVEGGAGKDELSAGKGRDKLYGGPGRDKIGSRDGQRDYVNCGSGKDVLAASDRKDRVVGCEKRFLRPH